MKPSNGNNPEEPRNDKFVSKTYTFDVTKCLKLTHLKLPPLEQRQKRGYCKFHGNFGHDTSCCVVFRDSVQKTLNEGRLKFGDKPKQPIQFDNGP